MLPDRGGKRFRRRRANKTLVMDRIQGVAERNIFMYKTDGKGFDSVSAGIKLDD
jgi:hypothetical protein